ncbi:MAG: FapA family protein [Clostridiales bacterium]|nr:FapA family protein [Clostridiales bacterium]
MRSNTETASSGQTMAEEPVQTGDIGAPQQLPTLDFPPEHTLCGLHRLWSGAAGGALQLPLFSGELPIPMEEARMAEEAARLHQALTQRTIQRWEQVAAALVHHTLPDLDGEVFLHVSQDAMLVWCLLLPPVGAGKAPDLLAVMKAMAREKVDQGVDWDGLKDLLGEPPRCFVLLPIAWGTPPVCGEDGRVVELYPREQTSCAMVDELWKEDYISLNLVQNIEKGEVICHILPPGKGTPGKTVRGQMIPPREGLPAQIPKGRNTALSKQGDALIATENGHVEFTGHSFQVKPVLQIHGDATEKDGIIQFMGDIHIYGDVNSGTVVRATGSIQIDGVVEDCTIEAGEYLVVSSGIQGQHTAVIQAHKGVYAKYVEHCTIYALESVQADCIIDSSIYSNGTVKVRTGRASVVGGTIRAAKEVSAGTIGSKAERPTEILLGGMPCEAIERNEMLQELTRTEEILRRLQRDPDRDLKREEISKLNLSVYVTKLKLEKLEKDLERSFVRSGSACRMLCDEIYPGAVVTIGGNSLQVTKKMEHCVFYPGKNKIAVSKREAT